MALDAMAAPCINASPASAFIFAFGSGSLLTGLASGRNCLLSQHRDACSGGLILPHRCHAGAAPGISRGMYDQLKQNIKCLKGEQQHMQRQQESEQQVGRPAAHHCAMGPAMLVLRCTLQGLHEGLAV